MFQSISNSNVLFLDIETAAIASSYENLSPQYKSAWDHTHEKRKYDEDSATSFDQYASLHPEFACVVCISYGVLRKNEGHIRNINGLINSEVGILTEFYFFLKKNFNDITKHYLCGHFIKGFDVPFLAKRMLINGMNVPNLLNTDNRKPWELKFLIDTKEAWQMGDFKNAVSLNVLCAAFNIPSPKTDIEGKDVSKAFWNGEIERIAEYCNRDVLAVMRLYCKLSGDLQEINLVE